ncbi:MAG: carbohydrate kinase [Pseudaminobacter sp.]
MILCCGEALIDMLPRESRQGEPAFAPYPGGAVFNAAIALGRLGVPVEFFSGLSSDIFGRQIREVLASSNVGSRYAVISARPTTLAFVRLSDGQASYTFYDENTAGRMLSEGDLPLVNDDIAAMLFGAISLIPEPCGSAYEALMRRECDRRVTMLDPNIRPSFIADRQSHVARIRRMVKMADIVKLSGEDLAWLGHEDRPEEVIGTWLDNGPKLVVLTHGAEGAVAYTARHKVTVAAERVDVVDTVGAGDTFNAGLLASLHEQGALRKDRLAELGEAEIRDALALGVKAATITVSRAGANPPWRHEIG